MKEKENNSKVNYEEVNELVGLSKRTLQILYIILVVAIIYLITMILKNLKILKYIFDFLSLLTPFFIGFVLAWLLDPVVSFLQKKGVKRIFGTFVTYLFIISFFMVLGIIFLPRLYDQVIELTKYLPTSTRYILRKIDDFVYIISERFNMNNKELITSIKKIIDSNMKNFVSVGPAKFILFIKAFITGGFKFLVSLVIGFYMLVDFDSVKREIKRIIPVKYKKNAIEIVGRLQITLRQYVKSAFIVILILFFFQTIGFSLAGLKSPMAFGIFCALTNMIPYVGPYIGGIPAVIFGFSMDAKVGVLTMIAVVVCQLIESNLITPNIMSKTMKLHPVVIIVGLTIFGSLFGIIGMLLSTPIISCVKVIFDYYNEKYHFFSEQ